MSPRFFILLPIFFSIVEKSSSEDLPEVRAPSRSEIERLELDSFYNKYLDVDGFPIVSSDSVSDFALREAAFLIESMLGGRSDILEEMTKAGVRLAIMGVREFTTDIPEHATLEPRAYWDRRARGLGATKARPAVSVGEENLLGYRGDPYEEESIFVHEFAHAIHEMGLNGIDPEFQSRLEETYDQAMVEGLWNGKYAASNPSEYWAEGVQSWFDTNRENDDEHNHVNTREELLDYDPRLATLIESVFGDSRWRYLGPGERDSDSHLVGFNMEAAPEFAWPAKLIAEFEALERGDDLVFVELGSPEDLPRKKATSESGSSIALRFENEREEKVSVYWIGFDGIRRFYQDLQPGAGYSQPTYGSHLWVVVGANGLDIGWLTAPEEDARVVIPPASL
ncbi:MAG: hypothetical protein AAGC68_11305 [Verrucomicrobiota bacterium]